MIPKYGSIETYGHRALVDLWSSPVNIEEKVDGSQISFGVIDGVLYMRSKGAAIHVEAPNAMFSQAVQSVLSRKELLNEGWVYRGEYLQKPKHNVLSYNRVPLGNIIIFDISTQVQGEHYLSYVDKHIEATRLGFECVPLLGVFNSAPKSIDELKALLSCESVLGGPKIEGIVLKNYEVFGPDHTFLIAKIVSDEFKEVHRREWGESKPAKADVVTQIGDSLRTEARWDKAIQHLREDGKLTDSPRDIGPLIAEITRDVWSEERDWIVARLLQWVEKDINRLLVKDFAQWYKDRLMNNAMEESRENTTEVL